MRGKTPTNFVKPNCIMQLADSVSVAKIKIIYASRQRAHSEPSPLIWRSCAFNRRPMTMPVLDGPMTMPVLDGPMTMPVLDGPMTKPVLDGPMTMPVLDGPMTMPVLDGVKPMAITLPICGTSESLFWKRKKHILLDSVETNLNIWRVRWPSPRQVRVQIPMSPRQVRDDRKTSRVRTRVRDRTRVLQP